MSDPVTLQALLSTGADTAAAIGARPQRPRRHRAAQRARDGHLLHRLRLGVASAPLNPAYRADEFEFYLST
jgi:hypothetical protein